MYLITLKIDAKFEKNWFVVSKITRVWWSLNRALKSLQNLHFYLLLLCKVFNFWPKKSSVELSFMRLNSDPKFEEKLTCGLENDMRNMAHFHQSTWKSENWDLDRILLIQSRKRMSLKFTEELCVTTMKNDAKLEEELTCHFKIDIRILNEFWSRHLEV